MLESDWFDEHTIVQLFTHSESSSRFSPLYSSISLRQMISVI